MENSDVIRQSKILAAAIKESEEYKNYKSCYNELIKNPQLYADVNEMRRFNMEIQNAEGVPNMYDEVAKIFDRYAYVRSNVTASRFLRAEMGLCRMVQEMVNTLFSDIDFSVDFLD